MVGQATGVPMAIAWSSFPRAGRAILEADARAPDRVREGVLYRDPDTIATIVYTMDESGDLKGAMLTHANLLANLHATEGRLPLRADDLALPRGRGPMTMMKRRQAIERCWKDVVDLVYASGATD